MQRIKDIKPTYKKTPVGIIPAEWEVHKFEECFKHLKTYTFSRNELTYEKQENYIYNIHYGDIHSVFPKSILDTDKYLNLIPLIINAEIKEPTLLQEGDLIMADASEDYEGVGQSIELINIGNKKIVSGTHTFALREKRKFAPKYKGFIFSAFNTHKELKKIATGISVYGLSKSNIAKINLPIPPLPEQKAIADCLSTWDRAIEKQTQLIHAKKEFKKGLMQGFFNGQLSVVNEQGTMNNEQCTMNNEQVTMNNEQLRIVKAKEGENFTEDWEEVRLGEIYEIEGGGTPSTTNKDFWGGKIPWFTPTEIKNKYLYKSERTITTKGLKNSSAKLLPKGTLLFTSRATIGDIGFAMMECATNQGFQSFVPKEEGDIEFLYHWILQNKKDFFRRASGSTFPEISKKEMKKIIVRFPSMKLQTAIAQILQSADKEIELLEKKLEQLQLQKKGLMQVLLTGEKRLV